MFAAINLLQDAVETLMPATAEHLSIKVSERKNCFADLFEFVRQKSPGSDEFHAVIMPRANRNGSVEQASCGSTRTAAMSMRVSH